MQQFSSYKAAPNVDATDKQRGMMTAKMVAALNALSALLTNLQRLLNPPRTRAVMTTAYSTASGVFTVASFASTTYNTAGANAGAAAAPWVAGAPTRVTIPVAGHYTVGARVQFNQHATATGRRILTIRVGGVDTFTEEVGPAGSFPTIAIYDEADFAAGQYLEIATYQDTGAALNVLFSMLEIRWMHP